MSMRNKPLFVMGDLNEDLLVANRLDRIIGNCNLKQLITKPTRITDTSKTLLDVIITNNTDMVIKSDVYPCEIADHELISMEINISKPKRQPIYKQMHSFANYSPDIF